MRQVSHLLMLFLLVCTTGCEQQNTLILAGGPAGGTFYLYAQGLSGLLNKHLTDHTLKVERSGGSLANLRRMEKNRVDMALVFAGDAYVSQDPQVQGIPRIERSLAVARLYDSVAQLIVRQSSPITMAQQLVNTRVAVGSPGSGSALSARRFFEKIGIWDRIVPVYISLAEGMNELNRGRVEAVWAMVGFPDQTILQSSRDVPIRLIALFDEAVTSGVFTTYPFYGATQLLAGTYRGMDQDIMTFADGALWLAQPEVPADYVYRALKLLYSRPGQRYLSTMVPVGMELDPVKGRMGVRMPLHPGAARFWEEFRQKRLGPT